MKLKSVYRESAAVQVDTARRPVRRVVVARRVDSKRPARVWLLLLPPGFGPRGRK